MFGGGTARQVQYLQVVNVFLVLLAALGTIYVSLSSRLSGGTDSRESTLTYGLFQTSIFCKQEPTARPPLHSDLPHGTELPDSVTLPVNRTLIIYVFSNTDALYLHNLIRFIRVGVEPDNEDGSESEAVDYLIILNGVSYDFLKILPPLATTRARYVLHPNKCFDLGTIGWALRAPGMVQLALYKWIIWVNSSVRGPFLPASHPRNIRWHEVLTSRLNRQVKIVGSLVSCEYSPHIQSYLIATDLVGIRVLLTNSTLGCHQKLRDAIFNGELAGSRAIREAGYNMDALVRKYSGLDWRLESPETRKCWNNRNPMSGRFLEDSENMVMEIMFVKVKRSFRNYLSIHAMDMDKRSINQTCFNWKFYSQNLWHPDTPFGRDRRLNRTNEDAKLRSPEALWSHFLTQGYPAGQVYRMNC